MSFISNYKYDIYIGYSHTDNLTLGKRDGWIEQFYKTLSVLLAQKLGRLDAIKIWWDSKRLSGSSPFDEQIGDAIRNSAIFISLVSPGYLKSQYSLSELALFYENAMQEPIGLTIDNRSRLIKVLLNNIPHIQLPDALKDTIGFNFHDELGDPIEINSPEFYSKIKELGHDVIDILIGMKELEQSVPEIISKKNYKELNDNSNKFIPLNEGKLILVGRGGVGKTSVVNRLIGENFQEDELKTQGINITDWSLTCNATNIKLHIWDFGGQEIMHATHQFFMTDRSLYLLVISGREGTADEDVEYWLKHIETFGKESSIIVVLNKIGEHEFDLNYRGIQNQYPQICAFVKTDCKKNTGIDKLYKEIQQNVLTIPDIQIELPSSWFKVKGQLERMEKNFIEFNAFKTLCVKEGLINEEDHIKLSWILHYLGIILNYSSDLRLKETSVLKPKWVTEGIYKILNSSYLTERKGGLWQNELNQILPVEVYPPDKHLFLLELMKKFNLCFAFHDNPDRYLIPELLGKEEPQISYNFNDTKCVSFEYHYATLPEGIIPRFIVRSRILSQGQPRWKTGVILHYEESRALIKVDLGNKKINIKVEGESLHSRRELLAIIRYDFDYINHEFTSLNILSKVPLPDYPNYSIDYKKLIMFEKKNIIEFPEFIDQKIITVKVKDLLDGVDLKSQQIVSLTDPRKPISIFMSYSHKDENLRDELEVHLKLLQRKDIISTWHDRKIMPGSKWSDKIDSNLENANLILLLISSDFIASDYCWEQEVKRAMDRHFNKEAIVIPVILRPCDWEEAPFGKLQGLPKNAEPVTLWANRDLAWTNVVKGLRAVI